MSLEFTSWNAPRLGGSRLQGILTQGSITPSTILGSNLKAWFRADLGTWQNSGLSTPAVSDGDPVGGWVDQSTNAYNVLQATAADKGTLKLNILNGHPVVRFNGSTDTLASVAFTGFNPFTIVLVVTVRSTPATFDAMFNGIVTGHRAYVQCNGTPAWRLGIGGTGGPQVNLNVGSWYVLNGVFNGTSSVVHINGGTDQTGTANLNETLTGITLGSSFAGDNGYSPVDFAEVIVASGALSNTVRAQLDSYCDGRYAIY